MNVKTIWYPMTVIGIGVIAIMVAPGSYNGHSFSELGWVVAIMGAITLVITVALVIRDQNVRKEVSSNMLKSPRTNVMFREDDRDHHLPR